MDFTDKMKLRGKAEEDLYFAERDRKLIEAYHALKKQVPEELLNKEKQDLNTIK
ncbi:hypothetical protein [Photobacterium sanctipauli]|nr:hypothetical protein [Photobacterium sanctipauli]